MVRVDFRPVAEIDWQWMEGDMPLPPATALILPLSRLNAESGIAGEYGAPLGVRVDAGEDVEGLIPFLDQLSLIALQFPRFNDGRAYSDARILRENLGYPGEIRAFGDVLVDQLHFMKRCGFSSAQLAPHVHPEAAARALRRYSVAYQAASDDLAPAHRLRRLENAGHKEVA